MTYTDFRLVGVRQPESTVVCVLTQADGKTQDIYLNELVPFLTNAVAEFAMALEITVPAFAVLLALVRVGWYKSTVRIGV